MSDKAKCVCEKCGYVAKSSAGLASHKKVCEKRPDDATLLEMREEGMSYTAIGRTLGVSQTTARKWLRELGANEGTNYGGPPGPPSPRVFPEYAPLLGEKPRCVDRFGKPLCPFDYYCWSFLNMGLWVMCEAPTREELVLAEELGVRYEDYTQELRECYKEWLKLKGNGHATAKKQASAGTRKGGQVRRAA